MAQKIVHGKKVIGAQTVRKRYKLELHELYKLLCESKLKLMNHSKLYLSQDAVEKYFAGKTKEAHPVVINSRFIMAKYKISRMEFINLLKGKYLVPLPMPDESNFYFSFKAVERFFADTYKAYRCEQTEDNESDEVSEEYKHIDND
ncbi:MAG: hypothetical protein P4N60_12710 [Verrucomicrobiae bacterium]|nr:hypothetical protein [Verrucomicrobiae bacterium]